MHDLQISKSLIASMAFLFWIGVWAFGIGLILVGGLRWWNGDHLISVRLFNYLMPWFLIGTLGGIGASLLSGRYLLALLLVVPTLFIIVTYGPLFLPGQERPHDGFQLKVMSYNVWRENSNIHAIAEVIRKQKPDLILLQEIHRDTLRALSAELNDLYLNEPYVTFEERKLQAMISSFPLKRLDAGHEKGRAQKAIVSTPGGAITVLNVHPSRGRWQRRHKQMINLITDDIADEDNPLILGGDFNTTDQSQTYRLFSPLLKNAHWQGGWGFGFTYPTPAVKLLARIPLPPLVRIDHIFHSKHFLTRKASTLPDSGGSDHFPVIAELILKSEKTGLEN
jgi:endonuclease/exonuclease/phosphatase (EEP) superfamily protein YafD